MEAQDVLAAPPQYDADQLWFVNSILRFGLGKIFKMFVLFATRKPFLGDSHQQELTTHSVKIFLSQKHV